VDIKERIQFLTERRKQLAEALVQTDTAIKQIDGALAVLQEIDAENTAPEHGTVDWAEDKKET